jgi:uncharacterized NAD(P)/FAD-binding protein YdhS
VTEPGSVAIVGLGSRGLSVLERLLALAEQAGDRLRIELIDPVGDGAGVHPVSQPDYLLLNTICSQVSMFPDRHSVGDTVRLAGPSLYEWAAERNLRIAADGFSVGPAGRPIEPWDFLPRRLLGEYLGWFLDLLLARLPSGVEVRLHRSTAIRLSNDPSEQLRIEFADGGVVSVGHAFLTTGYTDNAAEEHPGGRLISRPYPMPERFSQIRPGQTVAIGGFGLSALDAMSCLTVGRGGRFDRSDGMLRYLPSGAEPRMLFYSRSGRACRARPRILRYGPPYRPLLFTPAGIDRLRNGPLPNGPLPNEPGSALDFQRQVWPLVLDELRIAHRRAQARAAGPAEVAQLERRLLDAVASGGLTPVLDRLDAEQGRFSPELLLDGCRPMSLTDATGYQGWLVAELAADLAEGELGLQGSVVKQTLDILRELRDTFRHAVDFGGLTPESNRRFFQQTVPVLNRAVVGPQFERHEELLALLELGMVEVPFGPNPAISSDPAADGWLLESRQLSTPHADRADWLVAGRTDLPAVGSSASPLLTQLFRHGAIRPSLAADPALAGIDVDRDQHPISATGEVDRRIWVLGPLCEGTTFYNNLVPSPGCYSRPIADAHRCVAQLLAADLPLATV